MDAQLEGRRWRSVLELVLPSPKIVAVSVAGFVFGQEVAQGARRSKQLCKALTGLRWGRLRLLLACLQYSLAHQGPSTNSRTRLTQFGKWIAGQEAFGGSLEGSDFSHSVWS
jgi:hypothetical protein